MEEVEIELLKADRGEELFAGIVQNNEENNVYVVFPEENQELLKIAYSYFDRFISEYDVCTVIASIDVKELANHTARYFEVVSVCEEEMECIINYLVVSSLPNVKIISLKYPHSHQKAEIIAGFKDITLEMIVCRGLYEIWGEL